MGAERDESQGPAGDEGLPQMKVVDWMDLVSPHQRRQVEVGGGGLGHA